MKSIKQQVEVSFNAVEIADVVKLITIMDAMSAALDKQERITIKVGDTPYVTIPPENLIAMYDVLRKLGFYNSVAKDPEIIARLGERE